MSPRQRSHRYEPWTESTPEPKTKREAAALARTWAEWDEAQPGIGLMGGAVLGVPWILDWQRNPRGITPPGYIWVRCLCFATLARPPEWRGRQRGRHGGWRVVKPAWTVGDRCSGCGAPYIRISERSDPYWPPEGWRLYRCLCGVVPFRSYYGTDPPPRDHEQCGAPFQEVAEDSQGYEVTLELGEQPGWREFWERAGRLAWAGGETADPPQE